MKVSDIMSKGARCVSPNTTIEEAAHRMKDLNVGAFPVCFHDKLAGIVTDRDIVIRGIADGSDSRKMTIRNVMTKTLDWCYEDDDLEAAIRIMEEKQIRRLPVLSRKKRLVGIISLADLAVKDNSGKACECLMEVSKPAHLH